MPGEGASPAVRDGQSAWTRIASLYGRRAGAGGAAVGGLSGEEVRSATQRQCACRLADAFPFNRRHYWDRHRHCLGAKGDEKGKFFRGSGERVARVALEAAKKAEVAAGEEKKAKKEALEAADDAKRAKEEADRKREEADIEKQIALTLRKFTQKLILRANPWEQANQARNVKLPVKYNISVQEILDRAAEEFSPKIIESKFPKQPLAQAEILETIAETYQSLGDHEKAITLGRAGHELRKRAHHPDHPAVLASLTNLAFMHITARRLPDASATMSEVFERLEKILDRAEGLKDSEGNQEMRLAEEAFIAIFDTIQRRLDLTRFQLPYYEGPGAELFQIAIEVKANSIPRLEKAARFSESRFGKPSTRTCIARTLVAFAQYAVGERREAMKIFEEVHPVAEKILPADDSMLLGLRWVLAVTYRDEKVKKAEAEALMEQVNEILQKKIADHPTTATCMEELARAYVGSGKAKQAVPLLERSLKLRKTHLAPNHPETLNSMINLAFVYRAAGQPKEAVPLYQEMLEKRKFKPGPNHPETLITMEDLAEAYRAAGQPKEAVPLYQQLLEKRKLKPGPNHSKTLITMNNLAVAYQDARQLDTALELYQDTLKRMKATDHPDTLIIMNNLALAHLAAKEPHNAVPLFKEYQAVRRKQWGDDDPRLGDLLASIGESLLKSQEYAAAEPMLREGLGIRVKKSPDFWTTFHTKAMLGGALLGQENKEKYKEAEDLLEKGYEGMKRQEKTIPPQWQQDLTETLVRLVRLYDATGNAAEADRYRKELAARKAAENEPKKGVP